MDNTQAEKQEALQAMGQYLERLIPGMKTLSEELKGDRQPDTDDFQKQCIDGLNWVIEIYNRISDIVNSEKINAAKQEFNNRLGELGTAIKEKEDAKIAELIEVAVIPFLENLKETAK